MSDIRPGDFVILDWGGGMEGHAVYRITGEPNRKEWPLEPTIPMVRVYPIPATPKEIRRQPRHIVRVPSLDAGIDMVARP